MDIECQEELPTGEIPQLAPCSERGADHVRDAQDRQDGQIHDGSGGATLRFLNIFKQK